MEEPHHGQGQTARVAALPFTPLEVDDEDTDDGHLPSMGSRNGKWWYSTCHNVTAMVGAGVLGLPSAMAYLGWGVGVTVMIASWVITLFTLWQMVQMHEGADGKRIDTYYELGQKAFGRKLGLWIVVPQQLVVQVGLDIVYIVTGGLSLWHFYQLVLCDHLTPKQIGTEGKCCGRLGPTTFLIIFTLPQFFLAQLRNFNSIAGISFAASVMSIGYCVVALSLSIGEGKDNHRADHVSYDFPHEDRVFGAFSELGTIAFAYSGHNVVLEIQATLSSNKKKPSKVLMWRGVVVAYIVVAFCYFTVAFIGYWAYGNELAISQEERRTNPSSSNILLRFRQPRGLLAITHLMVSIHMVGSYQLYAMPVFQMMELVLVKKFGFQPVPAGSSSTMRIVTRITYVFLTGFAACTFPFFDSLLGLVGGYALEPATYFLPCIIWLRVKKDVIKVFGVSWFINWALIIIGVLLMVIATTGGVRSFVEQAEHFRFFQFTSKACLALMAPSPSRSS